MTDFSRTYAVSIDAPVHAVFEYCRDPRRILAGDPKVVVSDVSLTPEGVGTTWHIVAEGVVTEETTTEYVEFVPAERIVWKSHPTVSVAGMTKEITHGPTWTWTFAPEDGGTRLVVEFLEAGAPWWQRAFDVVTEKSWSKEIRDWLAAIKAGTEAFTPQ